MANKTTSNTTSFKELEREIRHRANVQIELARYDYSHGIADCTCGIYDKWYRYSRADDGRAYDLGWQFQNEVTKNESVTFIERSVV